MDTLNVTSLAHICRTAAHTEATLVNLNCPTTTMHDPLPLVTIPVLAVHLSLTNSERFNFVCVCQHRNQPGNNLGSNNHVELYT